MAIDKRLGAAVMALFIGFVSALPAFSAGPAPEAQANKEAGQEKGDRIEAIKSYSAEHRDAAAKKGKAVLEDLDLRIERMKSKINRGWDRMDASARKKATASLEAIEKERNEIAAWYASLKLKASSAEAWEDAKRGFVKSYEALDDAFDRAIEKF